MNVDLGLMPGPWADRAACNGDDFPDAWHPGENAAINAEMTAYALRKCAGCPVRRDCLNFAISAGPSSCLGVWGGTTHDQRKKMWKARAA